MLLALDLATRTGACWGRGDQLPRLTHTQLPRTGNDVGAYLCAFEDWLRGLVSDVAPTMIVFEAPVLGRVATPDVTRKLHALAGVTEMVATRLGIDCREVYPVTVKKALTGSGKASKTDMIRHCRAFGLNPHTYGKPGEEASDEADAFGVWLVTIRAQFQEHAPRWEPLFSLGASA